MNYSETIKYVLDTVRVKDEFYVDLPGFEKPARIHVAVRNIAGTNWYDATSEVYKGDRFVPAGRYSANDLDELKHVVGLCWVSIQNHAGQSLDDKIRFASSRVTEAHLPEQQPVKTSSFER